jgi:hypothetical protein
MAIAAAKYAKICQHQALAEAPVYVSVFNAWK